MNSTETPVDSRLSDLRRHSEPAALWVVLAIGSVLLHLGLLVALRQYWTHRVTVEPERAPIAVEFVPSPSMAKPRSAPAKRGTPPGTGTPSTAPSQPAERQGAIASIPFLQPSPATPQPSIPRQPPQRPPFRQEFPSPAQPSEPPTTPSQSRPSPQPEQTASAPPSESRTSPQPSNKPLSGELQKPVPANSSEPSSTSEGAISSGQALPAFKGEVLVEILGTRQIADFKAQPAKPLEQRQQISIYMPPGSPPQPIELEAYLEINPTGKVLKAKPNNPGTSEIDERTQQILVSEIFNEMSFMPAEDGDPPKPVLSDLIVKIRITVPR